VLPLSAAKVYRVKPDALVSTLPAPVFAIFTVAVDGPVAAAAELDEEPLPLAGAAELVPLPLLPQAASITIAAAEAGPANHLMRIFLSIQGG
jgi:hypothetical protein